MLDCPPPLSYNTEFRRDGWRLPTLPHLPPLASPARYRRRLRFLHHISPFLYPSSRFTMVNLKQQKRLASAVAGVGQRKSEYRMRQKKQ